MIVRELVAKLGIGVDKQSFKRADRGIERIKGGIARIAAGLAAGLAVKRIADITTETARLGDQIAKTSAKLGVSAQALQEMRHAAELTGVPVRTMDMALQRFTRRAAEAAQGTGEAKAALQQMGVRLKDSRGQLRPTEDLLGDVAEAMKGTKSDGDRLRLAFKLFDSEGAALVNTLKGGKDALEEMRQEARDLGGIMDQELLDLSEEYTNAQLRQTKALRGVKNMIARNLLPVMIKGKNAVVGWIKENREWLRTNITGAIEKTARVVGALARAVRVMVIGLREAWNNADPVTKSLLKMSAAAAVLAVILASPILTLLAIGAAVGLVLEDFETWQKGGVSVIGAIDEKLGGFLSAVRDGETDLLNLGVAWEFWAQKGGEAIDWIGDRLVDAATWWRDLFIRAFKAAFDWIADGITAIMSKIESTAIGQAVARVAGAAGTLAGGGGITAAANVLGGAGQTAFAPVGGAAAGGAPVSMAPTLNVTVNNAQGMDESTLADEIGRKTAEQNEAMLRNAAVAFGASPAQ
jgi:hypothetical protein